MRTLGVLAVAEQFAKTTDFKTPVIESTGSGGDLKLFCAGVGMESPDVTNSSRRIKAARIGAKSPPARG